MNPPKSLGLEWVKEFVYPLIDSFDLKLPELLNTYVEHAAFQISNCIDDDADLLVTGGGTYHTYFVQRLESYLNKKIKIQQSNLIDFKEALIFAFLGLLKLENKNNCLKSVTGASKDHCSGEIFDPK
jgi:anhydro-N-acetylmuramic acid kinase